MLQALLRRGADPNVVIFQEGSRGSTPLHFACLLEKFKHAQLLLEYGANPLAMNEYGKTPSQLLPADIVPSLKIQFKRIFDEGVEKARMLTSSNDTPDADPRFHRADL